jgi:hypothetical protein
MVAAAALEDGHKAASADDQLIEKLEEFYWDPEGFVRYVFPWGEAGTILAEWEGPDTWQTEELRNIRNQFVRIARGELKSNTVRIAIASGHGIGKTALLAWLILWFMSTRAGRLQIVVTAGTLTQLKTKVWRELSKWHDLAINKHWFEWLATSFKLKADPVKTIANAMAWSDNNAQSFAGTHEECVMYLFDEASTIGAQIWETSEGAFTTKGPHLWMAFSQNTNPQGRFAQCWTKFKNLWQVREIDARKARMTDKNLFEQWRQIYGEASDFFRVRVLGKLPKTGPKQFIGTDAVETAIANKIDAATVPRSIPLLMGIDVGGGGEGRTKVVLRRGPLMLDGILTYDERDMMTLASHLAHKIQDLQADVVFIDAIGIGRGVYDRLIQLGFANVVACYSGNQSDTVDKRVYYNPRIEWWARMKEWLKTGSIPDDIGLREELVAPEFYFDVQMRMLLESKADMQLRGVPSPDTADALALTFAHPVPVKMNMYQDDDMGTEPDVV